MGRRRPVGWPVRLPRRAGPPTTPIIRTLQSWSRDTTSAVRPPSPSVREQIADGLARVGTGASCAAPASGGRPALRIGYRYQVISLRSRSISTRDRCVFLLNLRIEVGNSTAIVSRAARAPHNEAAVIPEFVVGNGFPEAAQASRRAGKQICKDRKPCSESSAQRATF